MDAAGTQAKFEDCLAYAGIGAVARRIWKQLMQGKVRAALRQLNLGDE